MGFEEYVDGVVQRQGIERKPTRWREFGLGMWALVVSFICIMALWNGWLAWLGWTWFFVPLGLPEIGLWHAFMLVTFISWVARNDPLATLDKTDPMAEIKYLYRDIKRDVILLVAMWIFHFVV